MNTEQLKQAAMAATPGPWLYETSKRPGSAGNYQLILSEDENSVAECYGTDHEDAANGRYIAAANPAVILALLECVDALRLYKNWCDAEKDHGGTSFWDRVEMCREAESATDAALQKLEAL